MGFTFWLSRKLRINGYGGSANATGVVIAVAGVALALIIMEFTIAIVTGFKHRITERITGFEGQIWVQGNYDVATGTSSASFVPDDTLLSAISSNLPGAKVTGKFTQPGLIKTESDFTAVYFVAYDSTYTYDFERSFLKQGDWPDFNETDHSADIVISRAVSEAMRLNVGDKTMVCFFVNDAVKSRKFNVAAIYDTGFGDYDKTIVFAGMDQMHGVAGTGDGSLTQLSISGIDDEMIMPMAARLQNALIDLNANRYSKLYPVDNVRHTGMIYYNWLDLMDTNVVVIFILMLAVAAVTLVSSMFIIILGRISTIGILRSLGATKRQVRSVFINLSMKIVLIGMAIGNIIGIGLLLVQKHYEVVPLDPEMYYLDSVPVEINPIYIILLNIGVLVATWLILVLPSRLASRISPAVTMRFE